MTKIIIILMFASWISDVRAQRKSYIFHVDETFENYEITYDNKKGDVIDLEQMMFFDQDAKGNLMFYNYRKKDSTYSAGKVIGYTIQEVGEQTQMNFELKYWNNYNRKKGLAFVNITLYKDDDGSDHFTARMICRQRIFLGWFKKERIYIYYKGNAEIE